MSSFHSQCAVRQADSGIDVLFVCMPYAAVERPSVALGALSAVLAREGLSTRTIHANLAFAEVLGKVGYEAVNSSDITMQIGEWTFAEAAFGGNSGNVDAYVDYLVEVGMPKAGLKDWLMRIRAEASAFVTKLARQVVDLRPKIVGCSSVFQQHCGSLALLRHVKELDPSIITMLGGANCEAAMGAATHKNYSWVDYVVSGEADKLLPDLCRLALACGTTAPADSLPFGVFGPASRSEAEVPVGDPTKSIARVLVQNLDELPAPDFDDYFGQLERSPLRDCILPAIPIETSRGCWWGAIRHCAFCGLNGSGMAYRAKSEARVEEDLIRLSDRYGLKKFMTVDNILDHRYFRALLPNLAERGDMLFFYETKANLSRAQLKVLSRAGVRWIQPGIEALNDDLLALLEKGCSLAINVQLLKWAYNEGIWVIWNHLFAAPGDNPEWYEKVADLIPLLTHLQPTPSGGVTRIRYDRFSPYFNKAAEFGLRLKPYGAYGHVYPVDADELANQAYFFRHEGPSTAYPTRLGAAIAEWSRLFYGSPVPGKLPHRSPDAPVLTMEDDGEAISIRDTRPCAVEPWRRLDLLESEICRACDGARSAVGILEALRAAGSEATDEEIVAARDRLVALKIVADLNGKFLCLATDARPTPYEPFQDFAGGLLLTAGRRPAARPADVWSTPVQEMFAF